MSATSIPAAAQAGGIGYETWNWDRALKDGAARWAELLVASGANLSLHPGWIDAVVRSHGVADRVRVLSIDSQGAAAFVPVYTRDDRVHGVPVRCLELTSNLVSYHAEVLSSAGPAIALEALFDHAKTARADVVRIANIADGSATESALREIAGARRLGLLTSPGDASPYLPMTTNWDGYVATRVQKFRANLTRSIKQMAKSGETAMTWFEGNADVQKLLADMLVVEDASWKAKAGIAISQRAMERDYYSRLLPFLAANGALFANVVYIDKPVGYVLCARWNGWVGQLKTSFDESMRNAGSRVMDESIRHAYEVGPAHEGGGAEYDFLGDADPHKLKWTDRIRTHTNYQILLPTLRSRLVRMAGALLKRRPKPVAEAASQPAPASAEE